MRRTEHILCGAIFLRFTKLYKAFQKMKANMQQIVRPMKIMIRFALMLSFISMCSPKMREDPAKEDGVAQDMPAAEVTARQKVAGDIPPRSETDISKGRNIFPAL